MDIFVPSPRFRCLSIFVRLFSMTKSAFVNQRNEATSGSRFASTQEVSLTHFNLHREAS